MSFFYSTPWLAGSRAIPYTHYFPLVHTNLKILTVAEAIRGIAIVVHPPTTELWQINALALSYPAVSIGLLTGFFSLMLALLWLRIRRLTSLVKGKDQRIKSILSVDPLTGLINRTALCEVGDRLLRARPEAKISLITLNLNRFKAVNDAFGHGVADELLRQVGQRIHTCLGPKDVLARTDGDEFALLLDPGDEERTHTTADRILTSIHQPFRVQSQLVYVQGRLGIAFAKGIWAEQEQEHALKLPRPDQARSPSFTDLLLQANIAMAQVDNSATGAGRQHRVFRPAMKDAIASQVALQQSIVSAIEQQQLRVRYQAIVDIQTGQPVGFEALVRWQHPERGLMSPDDFLPVAEELGLSFKIDRWMLKTVCQQLVRWRAEGLSPFVSVNLSGSHLSRADLVEYIRGLLACYAIEPAQLSVEVTEGVMIANLDQASETLLQLKNIGVGISLDDFGTGYSSLNYLQQLPIDVLKIDRSFIRCLGQSAKDCTVEWIRPSASSCRQDELIVNAILSLASALNIRVVVEGVERLDQWESLQKTSCGYVQGNYFSGAIEASRAQVLFEQSRARVSKLPNRI
ncbi:MAG: EAL domain-containing protein [Phormidesmis sp.]